MFLFVLLASCGKDILVTPIPATPTIALTNTLLPSPTIVPNPTEKIFSPLSEKGPYLLIREDYSANKFILYDVDGAGKKIINLPLNGYTKGLDEKLNNSVSPDGKWLVFYTGSFGDIDHNQELPITIKLLNLVDETVVEITDIVADTKLVDFASSIFISVWSPDARQLAFSGAIDGTSSDVYLYNINLKTIRRINDDDQDVSRIWWSPNGEYIVLENYVSRDIFTTTSVHFIKPTDETIKTPKPLWEKTWGGIIGWLSSETILMTGATHTAGFTNLDLLNVSTGQEKHIWNDLYGDTAIDYQNQIIAMSTSDYFPPENPGIYFIDFNGNKKLVLDGYYYNLVFRGGNKNRFLALDYSLKKEAHLMAIALDGTTTELKYVENYESAISPDYSWLLIYNGQEVNLYDEHDNFVRNLEISGIYEITWRPDSKGFFYSTREGLHYLEIRGDHKSVFVDKCMTEGCSFQLDEYNSVWLP